MTESVTFDTTVTAIGNVFSDVAGGFSDDDFAVMFVFCDEFVEEGLCDVVDV